MSVSPKPELIVVDTPPDSPVGGETPFIAQPATVNPSPRKRARKPSTRQRKKARTPRMPDIDHDSPSPVIVVASVPVAPSHSSTATPEGGDSEADAALRDVEDIETCDPDAAYSATVIEERAGFYPITRTLFVVQGWDRKRLSVTDSWFHLQRVCIGKDAYFACTCPHDWTTTCVHTRFLRANWEEKFSFLVEVEWDTADNDVAMFSRQHIKDADDHDSSSTISTSLFTVSGLTMNLDHLNSRAIVTHTGTASGDGTWRCTKDRNEGECRHINAARDHLQKLVLGDPDAIDVKRSLGQPPMPLMKDYDKEADQAISYLAIMPPSWASLDTDRVLYARPDPVIVAPDIIPLNVDSKSNCPCQAKFDPSRLVIVHECVIYTLTGTLSSTIQVQTCPTCPAIHRRHIGPDCRELGIFNFDNDKLFTHDLLNEYTSAYTSSETPFVAWASVLSRRYESQNSTFPFISADTFRDAWFAFSILQDFDGDMRCAKCGPSPEDVLWDGVTLAFSKKKILTSMQPPTTLDDHSISRPNVRYDAHQQLIRTALLRKLLRQAMNGPGMLDVVNGSADLGSDGAGIAARAAAASEGLEFAALLEQVEGLLRAENDGAANIFVEQFGIVRQAHGYIPPNEFRRLFLQLAAEESVLQLATRPALHELGVFISSPTPTNASQLVSIPSVYDILKLEQV